MDFHNKSFYHHLRKKISEEEWKNQKTSKCIENNEKEAPKKLEASIKLSSLARVMKKLNLSYKKIGALKNSDGTEKNMRERKFKSEIVVDYMSSGYDFIYVDESSFNLKDMHLEKGWARKGIKVKQKVQNRSENYSLLAAISMKKVEAIQIVKGGVKASDFWWFVDNLLKNIEKQENKSEFLEKTTETKKASFMDNASIHKKKSYLDLYSRRIPCLFSLHILRI